MLVSAKTRTGQDVPAFVTPDGTRRLLTVIPGQPAYKVTSPWKGSQYPVIEPKDYPKFAFNRRRQQVPIWDQLAEGSCVAHGLLRAMHKARLDSGQADIMLSRAMAYALVNDGIDAGSNPADLIHRLIDTGVCTEALVPYRFLVRSQLPPEAFREAERFRLDPAGVFTCDNFDEAVNAIIHGCHLGVTVFVAGDWNRFDADGCPPAYRGIGNHEVNAGDALVIGSKGEPLIEVDQSWSAQWGRNGRCNFRRDHFDHQPGLQIYAIKFPGQDPQDPERGPVAA